MRSCAVEEVADCVDRDVGRRVRGENVRVVRELPLLREHGRHALSPVQLRCSEDPHLVVHEHIPLGGVPPLDVVELVLLVHVDEDAVDGGRDACSYDLPRLEDGVAVGQHDRRSVGAQPTEHVERARVETLRERVLEEVLADGEQPRVPRVGLPPLLDGTEVVAVAELHEAPLLDRPVRGACVRPVLAVEVALEILADAVVVEERVVDVDEEGRGRPAHRDILSQLRHDLGRSGGPKGRTRE